VCTLSQKHSDMTALYLLMDAQTQVHSIWLLNLYLYLRGHMGKHVFYWNYIFY